MQNMLSTLHTQIIDPDRIPLAIMAIIITIVVGMITGPMAGKAYPLYWSVVDTVFGGFGDRINRASRKRADLMFRGLVLMILAVVFAMMMGRGAGRLIALYPEYAVIETLLLTACLSSGAIWFALLRLYTALDQKNMQEGAYYAIAVSSRRNLSASDDYGITRTGMALGARGFNKSMVTPVFWYLIGGLPLAFLYGAVACLAWRFGKDGASKGFGDVMMAVEKLLGIVPSVLAAALLAVAALFTPLAKLHKGIGALIGMKNRAKYEEGGAPLSVMAWSLGVSLGGASQDLSGSAIKSSWVGAQGATAKVGHNHLRYAIFICIIAHVLFIASLLGAYVWANI